MRPRKDRNQVARAHHPVRAERSREGRPEKWQVEPAFPGRGAAAA